MPLLDRILSWAIAQLLRLAVRRVRRLQETTMALSPEMQKLSDAITKSTEVMDSSRALIQGLSSQLQAAKNDPAEVQRLADMLSSHSTELATAVAANTVAQPGDAKPLVAHGDATASGTSTGAQPSGAPNPPTAG